MGPLFSNELSEAAPVVSPLTSFEPLPHRRVRKAPAKTVGQWIVENTRKKRRKKDSSPSVDILDMEKSQSSMSTSSLPTAEDQKEPLRDSAAASRKARKRRAKKKRQKEKKAREREEALKNEAKAEAAKRSVGEEKAKFRAADTSDDDTSRSGLCQWLQPLIVSYTLPIYTGIFKYSSTSTTSKTLKRKSN